MAKQKQSGGYALSKSEQQYRSLIKNIQAAVVVHGADTQILVSNVMAQQLLGLSEEQMLGKKSIDPAWHFFREDGSPLPLEEYPVNQVLASSSPLRNAVFGVHRPLYGEDIWVLVNADPVFDESGVITQVIVTFVDITERKRIEQALADSEVRLTRFIGNLPAFFFTFRMCENGKLCFPYASPGIKTLYGLEPEDVREDMAPLHMLAHPDDRPNIEASIDEAFRTLEPFHIEFRVCRPDMPERWLECRSVAVPDSEGNPLWHGIMLDITDRKVAELQLKQATGFTGGVINAIPDILFEVDAEGRYLNVWTKRPELLAEPGETLIGKTVNEVLPPDTAAMAMSAIHEADMDGISLGNILRLDLPEGTHWFEHSLSKLPSDDPAAESRFLVLSRDVTDRIRMEEKLRASEQRFHAIFDLSFQLNGLLSTDGTLLEANQAALELAGVNKDEVLGKPFWETPWWSHSAELQQQVHDAVLRAADGHFVRFEAQHPDQDGNMHIVDFSLKPVTDADGRVIQLIPEGRDITERKRTEEALRSQRDQLSNIYATSPVGITMVDRNGQIIDANPQAEKVLGLERKAIRKLQYNAPAWKITSLDGSPFPDDQLPFTRVKTTGQPVKDVQHAIQWPDGHHVFLSINAAPLFDKAGQFDGMISSIEDITERKRAETAIQESAQALNEAQRIAHLGSWYMDLATNEIYWSEELYKMYGFDPALPPPLYTESAKLFTPESWELLSSSIAQAVENGTPYEIELEMKPKGGECKWMLARGELVRDAQGRPVRVRGIAQDITERKEAEKKLLESEQQFRSLAENSPDNIIRYDRQCRLIYYNPTMLKTLPDVETFLGKTPVEVGFGGPEASAEYEAHIRHVLETGESSDMELLVPDPQGRLRNHLVRFAPEQNEQSEVTGVIAIGRDITELKQAEDALRRNERRYRNAQAMGHVGNWEYNLQTTHFWGSDEAKRIYGFDPAQDVFSTDEVERCIPERERVHQALIDLIEEGKAYNLEFEIHPRDGSAPKIITSVAELQHDEHGNPLMVVGVIQDITQLKQAEKERQLYAEFLTNMDRINRTIQGADNLDAMMRDVLDEVLDIFNCDRSFLMHPCDPTAEFWGVPMERTRPEYPGAGVTDEDILMDADVAGTLELLLNSPGAVKFGPETEHPLPQEVSERYGFKSFMSMAIYPKVGMAWQFGIHQCSHGRVWTEAEAHLLEEIGRRLADGLSSLLTLRDLRESEARYQRLFDTANEGIWIQDENFVTTFVNEHMANMLGYSADELQGMKVTDFMTAEDAKDHVRKMEERSRNISDIYERRMRHKDGSDIWLLISATPVFENDRFHGSFAMLTDITARKEAEQQLATSEQLFRTLVEHSPDYIVRYNRDLQRIYINPALQEQFAVPIEQALGHKLTDASPLIDPESYMAHVKQAFETGSECSDEHAYRKPDGEIRWANSRFIPEFDLEGKITTVMVISTDITERKRAEKELQDAHLLFEGVVEQSPVPMALAKPTGELIFNKACADFLHTWDEPTLVPGIKLQEMKQPWKDYDKDGNPLSTMDLPLARALDGEVTKNLELQVERKDGTRRWEMVTGTPIYDGDGNMIAGFVTFPDITERKEAEEALRLHKEHLEEIVEQRTAELRLARDAAEAANKAKSVFLANMSHELRTPLNAILGFSQMMQQDSHLSTSQHETLDIINNSGEHLLKLINDVLEIAKIEAGKLQLESATFDLHALVREVSDMMRLRAEQKGLQLELDQSSEFPRYIMGDEARLRQILVNLLSNAVKFTDKGWVTIRLAIKNNARHHLVIEIEDTGPGVSKKDQQRMFMPFVQLPEGKAHIGSGLGLSIVYQFVQLMKGNIVVKSTPGKGSLFRVELPLNEAEETDIDRLSGEQHGEVIGLAPGQPDYRILIAEDQHDNQLLLAKLMSDIGLEVKTADNGKECVEIFKKWKPDLIWMDHRMPVMDGVEATRRIRKLRDGKKVKIVAVTASAFKEQQGELLAAGMDGFVRKPYQFSEIYDSMAQQLGIEFIYTEEAPTKSSPHILTPTQLEAVPEGTLNELRDAVESLDRERIKAMIDQITELDKELGHTLSHIADEFNYPSILEALKQIEQNNV